MAIKDDKFVFRPSFYTNFDKLCSYINDTTTKIKKVKPRDFTYGSCNTGYNLRFITPENISTFVDNYINALKMKLIDETFADANKFMVASIKKMLTENGCPEINGYTVNTRPMYVNQQAQTPSDLITFVEGEIVQTSIYSVSQIQKRFELIQEDMKVMDKHNFVMVTKRVVDALPKIISDKHVSHIMSYKMTGEVLMDVIGQFILFAAALNALTLKGIWLYAFPKQTLGLSIPTAPDRQDTAFVESACLKTDPQLISLTDGVPMNKTNMVIVREKLPVDMNIKNIVMMDNTRAFDETVSALKFMLTDERSPITHLILKYVDMDQRPTQQLFVNSDYKHDVMNITKMFVKYNTSHEGKKHEDTLFQTDNNWLDLVVSGNDFVDHNYRRDTVTNNVNTNPIVNTLEMIYRIYGECFKENKDLVASIIKISNIMVAIADQYNNRNIQNRPIVRDILLVFAEIVTRNMLKLYWNNNVHIDVGTNMDDTMSPGYIYSDMDIMESFVMEAIAMPEIVTKAGNKVKEVLGRFKEWIVNVLGNLFNNFKQLHGKDILMVQQNEALNKEIEQALAQGTMFSTTINNFGIYQIPYNKIKEKTSKFKDTIVSLADGSSEINIAEIQSQLLPDGVTYDAIKDPKNKAIVNYVLFGKIEGEKTGKIVLEGQKGAEIWRKHIIDNIIGSQKAISDLSSLLVTQLKDLSNVLDQRITMESIQEIVDANTKFFQENTAQPQKVDQQNQNTPTQQSVNQPQQPQANPKKERAEKLFNEVVMPMVTTYYTPIFNVIRNTFFVHSFAAYKAIITDYNNQKSSKESTANTPSTTTNQQTNQGDVPPPNAQ